MSFTNTTTHYGLPQYVATDKPKYLTDFNETMAAIDSQMYDNATAAATAQTAAEGAQTTADNAVSSIGTLNTQINGDPTDPSDTGLAGDVSGLEGNVNTINSLIGNGTPTTTDQTIIGAINEINAKLPKDMSDKHLLFVGDSYGDSTGRGFNCWPEFMAEALGLTSGQFNNLCKDSSGIYGGDNPPYMFITQLQNYAGDKTAVTDIVIGEASNDTFSDNPQYATYANVKSNLKDIVDYVKANYPNATLYIGYIANSYDTSSIIGTRPYRARQTFKQLLKEWCAELNIKYLNGVEYALCGGGQWFTSDLLHPSVTGMKYLGYAMARAYTSGDANVSYYYKNNYALVSGLTVQYGCGSDVSIEDNMININLNNWGVSVPEDYAITAWHTIATSSDIFFNIPLMFDGHIRLNGFNGKGDQYLPCTFRFTGNSFDIHIQELDNGSFVQSWTAGSTAFFTIDGVVMSAPSDQTA